MPNPVLQTQGVCKSFDDHVALAPLDVEVHEGRIVGLLGPNGAGKTTLLRMLTGITRPDRGTIQMWGEPHRRELLSRVGYLPEERGLYKSMRVAEQVLYFASLRGMDRFDAEGQLKEWFERLNVEGWWNREVADLSKGMAQKIQFIATVLHRPDLLILDEPFSGLDPMNANVVRGEMMRLVKEEGATLLLSTHDMGSVETLCDEVIMLHRGKRVLSGRTEAIREDARQERIKVVVRGDLTSMLKEMGEKAAVIQTSPQPSDDATKVTELELALCSDVSMPDFLRWAVPRIEVLKAVPIKLSMEEVFIQTVESATS